MATVQAQTHARRSREKADERRREAAGGISGWVTERSGDWSLDDRDPNWIELQKYMLNPLLDYWFRLEVDGWERLPEPPALLIGIHAGAPLPWDAWAVGYQWWRHFGEERPLHGTAHDALTATPLLGTHLRKLGVLPAAPDSIASALASGRDVALWPGGEVDSLRPWTKRDEAILAGRTGFVKMAIGAGVPIVPVATVGGPDAMPVIFSGRRLARALQLDRLARLKVFPFAVQAPWGLSPAVLPEFPFPAKIRTAFQDPIELDADPERANDSAYVRTKYDQVRESIQRGVHALTRRRRLPLFG